MNFCDACFEIPFSSGFHNPENLWILINYFDEPPNLKRMADVSDKSLSGFYKLEI